jgi:hypothetical protein
MADAVVAPAALFDLDEIATYIAADNNRAAAGDHRPDQG